MRQIVLRQLGYLLLAANLALAPAFLGTARAQTGEADTAGTETGEPETGKAGSEAAAEGPSVAYQAEIMADAEADLMEILTETSQLILLADRPPATLAALKRRADGDLERLQAALRSEGYYDGDAAYRIDQSVRPVMVDLEVETGPRYALEEFSIRYVGESHNSGDLPGDPAALGLEVGAPARAPQIVAAERELLRQLGERGYPLAARHDRKAVVNHDESVMRVTLEIDQGPLATFGPVSISGLTDVDESYLRELIPWTEGDLFDRRLLDRLRIALSETDLFASITVQEAKETDPEGKLPIALNLIERPHRSIGAELTYSTSEGPGGEVYWEHRNLLSQNETLRATMAASLIEQRAGSTFRKPRFWRADQVLLANTEVARRDNEAFEEESLTAFGGLERVLSDTWRGSAGLSLEFQSITDDEEGERTFTLVGLPVTATRDNTDDLLNPSEGTRLNLALTPTVGLGDDDQAFITGEVSGSAYYAIDEAEDYILAGRVRLGSIVGAETDVLPADKRFYSGGGGSVRAFGFQRLGPVDDDDDPVGGRSVFEVGAEVRIRILDDFGLVPFIEGGIVGDEPFVDFDEDFLWGGGLGLRYYSAVGPLRLDLAFPANPRDDDDFLQFYVSLGQAF